MRELTTSELAYVSGGELSTYQYTSPSGHTFTATVGANGATTWMPNGSQFSYTPAGDGTNGPGTGADSGSMYGYKPPESGKKGDNTQPK